MTENIINLRAEGHFTIHSEYMNFKGSLFLYDQKQCTKIRPESFLLMKWSIIWLLKIENCQKQGAHYYEFYNVNYKKNLMLLSDSALLLILINGPQQKIYLTLIIKTSTTYNCKQVHKY